MHASIWLGCVLGLTAGEPGWSREAVAPVLELVLKAPNADGLLIFDVVAGSQAQKAGLAVGDILTHYDGAAVRTPTQLVELARKAAREKRGNLLVLAQRGEREIEGEFDPAPLGLRLVPIRKDQPRTLWRPATEFEPNASVVADLATTRERWELLVHNNKPIGYIHSFHTASGDRLALRAQSRIKDNIVDEKRDVTVTFLPDRYLSLRSLHMASKDRTILDLRWENGELRGDRAGVPISEALPPDTVSSYVAGQVARLMPRDKGACMRCSYLEASSVSAAPFADLCCMGEDELLIADATVKTTRYEQTVFGEVMAQYWIDQKGQLVQSTFGGNIAAVRATPAEVFAAFPNAKTEFPAIQRLPAAASSAPKAN